MASFNVLRLVVPVIAFASLACASGRSDAVTIRVGPFPDAACQARTIADAIALLPADTVAHRIQLSNAQSYPIAGVVDSRNVTIEGGYVNCAAAQPTPGARTQIGPLATATTRLLRISAAGALRSVTLRHLEFRGPAPMGAIAANGPVDVFLDDVRVTGTGETSLDGGGIRSDGAAFVYLRGASEVTANSGNTGGGIGCNGGELHIEDDDVLVSGNNASLGGGIALVECLLEWSPGGPSTQGGIKGNIARAAGGALFATDSFIRGDGTWPRGVSANSARLVGGGLALFDTTVELPNIEITSNAAGDVQSPGQNGTCGGLYAEGGDAELTRFRIDGNVSRHGGAGVCLIGGATLASIDPASCGAGCRSISFNRAGLGGMGSNGGAIVVRDNGRAVLAGVQVLQNRAGSGSAVYATDDDKDATAASVRLVNALVARNQSYTANVFSLGADTSFALEWTTVADNVAGASTIGDFGGATVSIVGAIIAGAQGVSVISAPFGTTLSTRCVAANEAQSVAAFGGAAIDVGGFGFGFVDPDAGDYRLQETFSPVDFCGGIAGIDPPVDLDGNARPVDLPIGNVGGTWDAGAFETRPSTIFADSFDLGVR